MFRPPFRLCSTLSFPYSNQLREEQYPINATVPKLPLHINFETLGTLKFNIFASMQAASEAPKQPGMGGGMGDLDEVKRMLITANPYGLVLTAVVTVFHMIFEFLAFSSDVKHWRKKDKDLVGVSLRSIITNVVIQVRYLNEVPDSDRKLTSIAHFSSSSCSTSTTARKRHP